MQKPINISFKTASLRLKIAEHSGIYFDELVLAIDPLITSVPELQPLYTVFRDKVLSEESIFKKIQASTLTPELLDFHHERVSALRLFRYSTIHAKFSKNDIISKAHRIMIPLVNAYKKGGRGSYMGITGQISSFIDKCRTAEYAPHIQALNLTPLLNEMDHANTEFNKKYMERSVDREVAVSRGALSAVRPEVDASFGIFIDGVNTAYIINEYGAKDEASKENLTKIINVVNAGITEMKNIIARRIGRHHLSKGGKSSEK